ncbi:MAG TPA: hypothetical protein VHM88_01140, partial [Candidatus Acidoferrales bacterium]|nr:hypothetical protein [Candidatus Acidoferrales bacterium]
MKSTKVHEKKVLRRVYRLAAVLIVTAGLLASGPQLPAPNLPGINSPAQSSVPERRKQLSNLLAEQWDYTMRTNPEWASILGDRRFNDKSSDVSEKAVFADLEEQRKFLK